MPSSTPPPKTASKPATSRRKVVVKFKDVLAMVIVISLMGNLTLLQFHSLPENNRDLFNVMFGIFIGATLTSIIRHFYPSRGNEISAGDNVNITNKKP